jgi:hypothetical protein
LAQTGDHLYQAFGIKEIRHAWKQEAAQLSQHRESQEYPFRLPVLGDIERPFELQESVVIVINEAGGGIVVTTSDHAGGGLLLLDYWDGKLWVSWVRTELVGNG